MKDPNEKRAGYKETKVGWIPVEWDIRQLRDLGAIRSGNTPSRHNHDYFDGGHVPWVKTTDLNNGKICSTEECITQHAIDYGGAKVMPARAVLIAMYGGYKQIGRTGVLQVGAAVNQALSVVPPADLFSSEFVQCALNTNVGMWRRYAGSSRKDPNITREDVCSFWIPFPALDEQQKIAEILTTCDEVIEKTGELIEAKKRQKKALMQQLLTGRKRLPGFEKSRDKIATRTGEVPSDWKWIHLGAAFKKRVERSGDVLPLMAITIDSGMVRRDSVERKVDSALTESDNLLARKGDIAYNTMRMWQGAVGVAKEDCHVSPAYVVCAPLKNVADSDYYFYWFKIAEGLHLLWSYSYGITGDRLRLYAADFGLVPAPLPSIEEQRAIVAVLRTAEDENAQLKQKQSALKQQKKSLMQKLLTGQVRVRP